MLAVSREEGKDGEKFGWKDHKRVKSLIFGEENSWSIESGVDQERKICWNNMTKAIYSCKWAIEPQGELNLRVVQFASCKVCGRGQNDFGCWYLSVLIKRRLERGAVGELGRGLEQQQQVTSKCQINVQVIRENQRAAVKSWIANCKKQPTATCSSPLPVLSHTAITWRRGVKCKGRDRWQGAPTHLPDLFMCVLVLVQHLPLHKWDWGPMADWGMRGFSRWVVCKDTILFWLYCEAQFKGDLENHGHSTSHTNVNTQ